MNYHPKIEPEHWRIQDLSMVNKSNEWEMNITQKLIVGQHVEVLSMEKGLQGSWHCGVVIAMSLHQRRVMYKHLFETDHFQSNNIVESVPVSLAIDGILPTQSFSQFLNLDLNDQLPTYLSTQNMKRNNIRPLACRPPLQPSEATFGMCVDACIGNVHWEGTILDCTNVDQIMQRTVFFPDLGIEESVSLENLSLSVEWNDVTGNWTLRGRWKFIEALLEANKLENANLRMSVQQLWRIAQSNPYFVSNISAWTCGSRDDWFSLVLSLMHQLDEFATTSSISVQSGTFEASVSDYVKEYRNKSSNQVLGDRRKSLKEKCYVARSYLKSVGWKFLETSRGTKYYVSSEGTRYDSFITACEGYLSGKASSSFQETNTCTVVTRVTSDNKVTREPKRKKHIWNSVDLIPEFSSMLEQGAKCEDVSKGTMRKHLVHLGWIVESKRDTYRPFTRFRYHSPDGQTYYSLKVVFADLKERSIRRGMDNEIDSTDQSLDEN